MGFKSVNPKVQGLLPGYPGYPPWNEHFAPADRQLEDGNFPLGFRPFFRGELLKLDIDVAQKN